MAFFNQFAQCKPCGHSDPTQDTVKVNPAMIPSDKENVQPMSTRSANEKSESDDIRKAQEEMMRQAEAKRAEEKKRAEEELRKKRQAEEAAAARAAAEAALRQAAEKAAEEKRRLAQEQAAREAAEAARKAEAEEAARLAEEDRIRKEEEEAEELRQAQAKVNKWCKANGFVDMNTQKKKLLGGSKFPLHTAVKHEDLEMVKALVKCGAKNEKDSKGQTAYALAMKNDKNGSMAEILAALS